MYSTSYPHARLYSKKKERRPKRKAKEGRPPRLRDLPCLASPPPPPPIMLHRFAHATSRRASFNAARAVSCPSGASSSSARCVW